VAFLFIAGFCDLIRPVIFFFGLWCCGFFVGGCSFFFFFCLDEFCGCFLFISGLGGFFFCGFFLVFFFFRLGFFSLF